MQIKGNAFVHKPQMKRKNTKIVKEKKNLYPGSDVAPTNNFVMEKYQSVSASSRVLSSLEVVNQSVNKHQGSLTGVTGTHQFLPSSICIMGTSVETVSGNRMSLISCCNSSDQ